MLLSIAIGQLEIIPGRPDLNTKAMLAMIQQARNSHIPVIVFPELSIPGYLIGDLWEQQAFLRDCESFGRQIIQASQDICVVFGNIAVDWEKIGDDGRVRKYNACFTAQNGKLIQGNYPYPFRIKTLQPNYREFDESRHFYDCRKLAIDLGTTIDSLLEPVEINLAGNIIRLGCLLCEDGWSDDYSVKPIGVLAKKGVDLFVNISSSPFTLGKNSKRNRVFSKQARETSTPIIYVNNVGIQNNGKTVYVFDGCSCLYDCSGNITANCQPFTDTLQYFSVNIYQDMPAQPPIKIAEDDTIANIYQAIIYGISKFLSATAINKIVIGVSGGIDSAVCAALFSDILPRDQILLANMPSKFNSGLTRNLAEQLAKNLGCLYTVIPIEESVNYTIRQIEDTPILNQHTQQTLSLHISSFNCENIQARDRSARILAALASAFGGAFTCNANKSELSVGYSTFYGDLAGFLAPLADLWKHQVYELARYINNIHPRPLIPAEVFQIPPSAELSVEQDIHSGKGDPLIYDYHDYLFRAFMEYWNRVTPEEILSWYLQGTLEENLHCQPGLIKKIFPTADLFIFDLERWWIQYSGLAVAKRIQAPPVLAVSRRAYGFDHRESQRIPYFSLKYYELKKLLLNKNYPDK